MEVAAGDDGQEVKIIAESNGELTYQWYKCNDRNKSGAVKIAGATENVYEIPTSIETGEHFLFVKVIVDGAVACESEVALVTVS